MLFEKISIIFVLSTESLAFLALVHLDSLESRHKAKRERRISQLHQGSEPAELSSTTTLRPLSAPRQLREVNKISVNFEEKHVSVLVHGKYQNKYATIFV